jgi:hypothetical protein
MAAHFRSKLALSLVAGATVLAVAAPPAPAHTISLRAAANAVRSEAAGLGQVDRAKCWRPVVGTRRLRHRALCVAWWVNTPQQSCAVFYEVRMAANPSRLLTVIQTFKPWCGWPADLGDGSLSP